MGLNTHRLPRSMPATVLGAAVGAFDGAVVGGLVNSPGWFLGGVLWPLGGALLGALVGVLVAARRLVTVEQLAGYAGRLAWLRVAAAAWALGEISHVDLIDVVASVTVAVAITVGYFIEANALVDLAPRRFTAFATLAGALLGAAAGAMLNSGGWFVGGALWPLGGAVVGALVGRFLWAVPRRYTLFSTIRGVVLGALIGGLAGLGSGGIVDILVGLEGELAPVIGLILGSLAGLVLGAVRGFTVWARRPHPTARVWRIPDRTRPVIFLAPVMVFVGIALVAPTARTIYLSFRSRRGEEAVGFGNYRSIWDDDEIFNFEGLGSWREGFTDGDLVGSRLFLAGLAVAAVAVLVVLVRSVVRRRELDLASPLPTVSLTTAAGLVVLAMMGTFSGVIWNNIFWIVFVTGISTIVGLVIAVLADRARGESLAKSLIFLPMAISFVGASVIWRFVYAVTPGEQIGVLNAAWVNLGGDPQLWLQDRPWNSLFLIVIMIWIQTGFAMVILSAAIKGVPDEMREAARVDGASEMQTFWRVTLPHIRPTIVVVVTTLVVTVLKVYDIVQVMTGGQHGTNVIANQMFDEVFSNRHWGRGSALAVLLFVAVVPLMIVNVRRVRHQEVTR